MNEVDIYDIYELNVQDLLLSEKSVTHKVRYSPTCFHRAGALRREGTERLRDEFTRKIHLYSMSLHTF